jgi:hypothetical protein
MSDTSVVSAIAPSIPDIIKAASVSPLGILALMLVGIGIVAFLFFRTSSSQVRFAVLSLLLVGVGLYAYQIESLVESPAIVKGIVFSDHNAILGGVQVDCAEAPSVLTDDDGRFALALPLPKGQTTTLHFSKTGYSRRRIGVTSPIARSLEVELTTLELPNSQVETSPVVPKPISVCNEVKDMRQLGWSGGNKGDFCRARGYDGNWNPTAKGYRDYRDGGLCYKGQAEACYSYVGCTRDSC